MNSYTPVVLLYVNVNMIKPHVTRDTQNKIYSDIINVQVDIIYFAKGNRNMYHIQVEYRILQHFEKHCIITFAYNENDIRMSGIMILCIYVFDYR